ncbi:MAG: hypothetical protein DMF59_15990 [Acidobacteria bacterium]|nr:MAG: hypothetical protein DMF59_15990 [Acidobacteriota bacterium]
MVAADPPCPPPIVTPGARILYLGPASAGYSDELPVRARLVDENAAPMAARTLAFTFGGETKTATTGADGIANTTFTVSATPGSVPLLISFGTTQTTATIVVDRDNTNLSYTGSIFLATGNVNLSARLTHGGADHPPLPVANRPIDFTLGTHVATGVTDANGVATVNMVIADAEVGGGVVVVRFAGDAFYRESQDSRATFAFQGSAFVIWGGNATKPTIGQTVNFWGDQWVTQVTGGEWDSNASFKGWSLVNTTSDLCQADARISAAPTLTPGCWDSKTGNSDPPAQLPRYISAIVSTAIKKSNDVVYGNIAGHVVIEVQSPYDNNPGHPGLGKIVAVINDGAGIFKRPNVTSTLAQPATLAPGQSFVVQLALQNGGTAAATALNIQAAFDGAMPATATADLASLAPAETKSFTFTEQLGAIRARTAVSSPRRQRRATRMFRAHFSRRC